MPKVSVIVPIYNKELFLEKSIKSLLNQTLEDLEIILINDGSTDNSLSICSHFASIDNRIKVVNQKNNGVSVARNKGLENSTGKFITFLDPDDWVEKDMYLTMYNRCIETSSEVCIANYFKDYGNRIETVKLELDKDILIGEEIFDEIILDLIAPQNIDSGKVAIMGSVWRLLIKRSLIEKEIVNFPPNIPFMEDLIFCFKVLLNCKRLCYEEICHYHYCTQENSASVVHRKDMIKLQLEVLENMEVILKNKGLYELSRERLNNRYINSAISMIINEVHSNNNQSLLSKMKNIKDICSIHKIQEALKVANIRNYSLRKKVTLYMMKNRCSVYLFLFYKIAGII